MSILKKALMNPCKACRRLFSTLYNIFNFSIRGVEYSGIPYFDGCIQITASKKSSIRIGRDAAFNSGRRCNPVGFEHKMMLTVEEDASITIGNHVGMSNTVIYATKQVVIDDDVMLGNGVKIYDTDFHSLQVAERMKYNEDSGILSSPVHICKGAFVGAGVTILKGVTVGENAIVGACSVVTKNIPANEVWAGNPCKKIR